MTSDIEKISLAVELAQYQVKPNGVLFYGACCLGWKKPNSRRDYDVSGFFRPDTNPIHLRMWANHVGVSYKTELIQDDKVSVTLESMLGSRLSITSTKLISHDTKPTRTIFVGIVNAFLGTQHD